MMGWQWHQLDHMQIICTSFQTDNHALQTDNHASTSLSFYRPDALPPTQPTASKHRRYMSVYKKANKNGLDIHEHVRIGRL